MSRVAPSRSSRVPLLVVAACIAGGPLSAQLTADVEPAPARAFDFDLTIRNITRGPEHVGEAPQDVRWSDDGRWVYFRWRPGGGTWSDPRRWYRVPSSGGEPEELTEVEAEEMGVELTEGALSPDRARRVVSVEGDLHLVDRATGDSRRLTSTVEDEAAPSFSGDGSRVFFRRGDDVFAISLADGAIRQLTDLREGPGPEGDPRPEGQRAFLREQQERLFEHIRLDRRREAEDSARAERAEARRLRPFYRRSREEVSALFPTPGGEHVAVLFTTPPADQERTVVPDWITESGYTQDLVVRAKVGDEQSRLRIGIVETASGEVRMLDVTGADASEGASAAAPTEESRPQETPPADSLPSEAGPQLAQISFGGWNEAGTHGIVFAVDFDYKAWRLFSVEAASGRLTLLDSHRDEAWVGGPCFPGPRSGAGALPSCLGWIPGQNRVYYVSEETGWAHLYAIDPDGSRKRALTEGTWEVHDVGIPESRTHFLLQTGEASPFDRHVYLMDLDGSGRRRLFEGRGRFTATPAPSEDRVAVIHSRSNRPPELFLADYRPGAELDQVTVSPTAEWLTYPWIDPPIVRFTASDGAEVPARIYRPSDFDVAPNGAGVVFVHGAGYTQNVHHGWSRYYREYMFHHFLASQGYTVLDIDYRGSAGHGRDWRTAVYRWMGGADLSDQVDGASHLVEKEGVAPDRIGIYGGSYGGFITLMALFRHPDVFTAGAALRSVTDWAHYNHWYTRRILNQPQEDMEAYERSSPIYFAEGFEGHLLMAHGMVDTNVHFSDVVRLAQRLIELGKENWEMAVYPVENHGFQEPGSWRDEYRRIFELFDRTIGAGIAVERALGPPPEGGRRP